VSTPARIDKSVILKVSFINLAHTMPRSRKAPRIRRRRVADHEVVLPVVPAMLAVDDLVSTTFRYDVTSTTGKVIVTRASMLNLLAMAYSTSGLYRIIQAIRLRAVHIWTTPSSGNTSSVFTWAGPDTRPTAMVSTSMGTSAVSYQKHVPPKRSLAAFWSVSGSNESDQLFVSTLNNGDVIQLDVTYQLQNAATGSYSEVSITSTSTLALGYVYSISLDHQDETSNAYVSVGRLSAE
jgi:hypothetical protein